MIWPVLQPASQSDPSNKNFESDQTTERLRHRTECQVSSGVPRGVKEGPRLLNLEVMKFKSSLAGTPFRAILPLTPQSLSLRVACARDIRRWRAALDDFTLLSEHIDLVGLLDSRHQVPTDIGPERNRQKQRVFGSGDHDQCTAGKNRARNLLDRVGAIPVEGGCRLVQQYDLEVRENNTCS